MTFYLKYKKTEVANLQIMNLQENFQVVSLKKLGRIFSLDLAVVEFGLEFYHEICYNNLSLKKG